MKAHNKQIPLEDKNTYYVVTAASKEDTTDHGRDIFESNLCTLPNGSTARAMYKTYSAAATTAKLLALRNPDFYFAVSKRTSKPE